MFSSIIRKFLTSREQSSNFYLNEGYLQTNKNGSASNLGYAITMAHSFYNKSASNTYQKKGSQYENPFIFKTYYCFGFDVGALPAAGGLYVNSESGTSQ